MCRLNSIFTADELKTLSKIERDALEEYGRLVVLTDPAIRNMIKKDPKIQKKLKSLLNPSRKRLTQA